MATAKFPETNKYLNAYGAAVVEEQKTRLRSWGKAGGPSEEALGYKPFNNGSSFGVNFYGNEYTEFIDKGVEGSETKKTKNNFKSVYKYRTKQPPTQVILPWVKKKNIKFRNKKGRFIKSESAAFLIARSIFKRGSETTNFFTIPIVRSEKRFEAGMEKALAVDIENNIQKNIK